MTVREPSSLVERNRVHRSVYVDPAIFELELTRIFERTWIYIGHVSQVPKAGDYFATRVGRQPVVLVRGADNELRLFFNRCLHKGAQLVGEGSGNGGPILRCGYHGWTYALDGALRTVPAQRGYANDRVRPKCADFALKPVAALEIYRGFIFARLKGEGPGLLEWLGPFASSLDNFVDRAPGGEVSVAGGVLRYEHACNWKFFVENTLDALHPMVVHLSAARSARSVANDNDIDDQPLPFELQALAPFTGSYDFYDEMGARVMPNGHADLGGRSSIHAAYDEDSQYTTAMIAAYGEQRTREILSLSRNNSLAYPSVMFKAPVQLLRVIKPLAVDRTLIETWHFRLVGAPESKLARTLTYSMLVNSSAGMVGPDDHQIYRQLQSGLEIAEVEWVELSRYESPQAETAESDGSRMVKGTSDAMVRGEFAQWQKLMEDHAAS